MSDIQVQNENTTRQTIDGFIEMLVSTRHEALKTDNIVKANEIQRELSRLNVSVQDFRSGTRWKFN
jgi:cysteinyl-tRNA synthetase